jgi:hypothetical protein
MEQEKVSDKSIHGVKMESHAQNEESAGADVNENFQDHGVTNRATFGNSNQNNAPQGNRYFPSDGDVESLNLRENWSILSGDSSGLLSQKLPQFGYRRLATKMGSYKSQISLFRRFGDLNMLNLLSLQAEIMHLHHELDYACQSDDKINETFDLSRKYAFSFKSMKDTIPTERDEEDEEEESEQRGDDAHRNGHCCCCRKKPKKISLQTILVPGIDGQPEQMPNLRIDQWELILKLREKLKEYSASE